MLFDVALGFGNIKYLNWPSEINTMRLSINEVVLDLYWLIFVFKYVFIRRRVLVQLGIYKIS